MTPFVSIIIPLYNKAQYLQRCLSSILLYTENLIEIIVVDDCSIDDSWELAQTYSQKDSRVRVLKHEYNKGTYAARETGIRSAIGQYIFCVDPDDWIDIKIFDAVIPYMKKNIDIIASEYVLFYPNYKLYYRHSDKFLKDHEILQAYTSLKIEVWTVISKFIKLEIALQALNELNVNRYLVMSEDLLLFLTICIFAKTWQSVNIKAYYYWLKEEDSITTEKKDLNKILEYIAQTKYVLSCLDQVFKKYGHTIEELNKIKMSLFNFYRSQMEKSPFSNEEQLLIIQDMFDCVGIFNAYYSMLTYGIDPEYSGLFRIINRLMPIGSQRRKITKRIIEHLQYFYRFLQFFSCKRR